MNNIIETYYKNAGIDGVLLQTKLQKYERNKDIADEFIYWIENEDYIKENSIEVEGYTAEKLASLSKYLDGEGAFILLIELRENKERALRKIKRGFKVK